MGSAIPAPAPVGEPWPPRLKRQDFIDAASELEVEPAALRAVADVEASGRGFLDDGRPKILFEGHIFWGQLKRRGIDPQPLSQAHPGVLYFKWTREHYLGGAREYARLQEARGIHEEAALESTSWGLFQVMGFNYSACGFANVRDFLLEHKKGEREHLLAVSKFLKKRGLVPSMKRKDWESFARGYNGPGQVPVYSARLKAAYDRRVEEGWNA